MGTWGRIGTTVRDLLPGGRGGLGRDSRGLMPEPSAAQRALVDALDDVSSAVSSASSVRDANAVIVEAAKRFTGADKVAIWLLDEHAEGLVQYVPGDERIITVEDAAELQLHQEHVLRLESRPPNIEGSGQVTIRDLVRNTLRMRPDRIIVGEVRGGEALDMLQAMNTGHDGSLSTVHANAPRDALARIETMVLMAGFDLPVRAIREQAASAFDLLVHLARLRDGSRRVVKVAEVEGMEGDTIVLQDIFYFDYSMGVDATGKHLGHLKSTGLRPKFARRLEDMGIELPASLFEYQAPARR